MKRNQYQGGYLAVVLLVFVVVSVVISTAAISVSIANLGAVSTYEQGTEAMIVAESGAENAIMSLIRNPNYTGETLTVGTGTATISVSGTSTAPIITSVGAIGTKKRTIQVDIDRSTGIVSVTAWREVFQ